MKRDVLQEFSDYTGINLKNEPREIVFEVLVSDSKLDEIIRSIFTVDENTGLPVGDIAYFLSPEGNPQVKDWLLNNLLRPRSVSLGTSVEGVTDDLIYEFSRKPNESLNDYSERLVSIYDESQKYFDEHKDDFNK